MFKCELCEKEVKHTRNIIGAHMKMVHLISWQEYQEILVRLAFLKNLESDTG